MAGFRQKEVKEAKREYVISETLKMTLKAAHASRGGYGIYKPGISVRERGNLKEDTKEKLKEFIGTYRDKMVGDNGHTENIRALADFLTMRNRKILQGNKFRIGIAQKLLNLFLKYLWVSGEMKQWKTKMPPHCPFDNKIVTRLRRVDHALKNWTEIDSMRDYEQYLLVAQKASRDEGFRTIAEWELVIYSE